MSRKKKKNETFPQTRRRVEINPSNAAQRAYLYAIRNHDITFGMGSAGTGKTYLAAMMAMHYQTEGLVDDIVIARPAVNAGGEDIGFLPGGITAKMDPYVRPIYDAFRTYWSMTTIQDHINRGTIEICPLAYMRGRTFSRTFIIADEMQNAKPEQLLMLLTRLGDSSKMVITGDPIQSDVKSSCFDMAQDTLRFIDSVQFVTFTNEDVVRHPTVEQILNVWPTQTSTGA